MNKKSIVFQIVFFLTITIFSQTKQTIKVIVPNKTDEVYITGNQASLGNWNPKKIKMNTVSSYERSITVPIQFPATFKFTKGSWASEGITNLVDKNANLHLQDSVSKNIFTIKAWANDTKIHHLDAGYSSIHLASSYVKGGRSLKIALPKNYDSTKKYPVFYTTDADWNLFNVTKNFMATASLEEYQLVPESIIVGIVHGETDGQSNRNKDLDVFYKESGKNFKNFLFQEAVPYIEKNYNTSGFNVMVGHSNGAQYNHYLLLEEENPFRGFISLSTNFYGVDVRQEIGEKMKTHNGKKMYYFVANATQDSPDRIAAGKDYEKLYNTNQNAKFQFSKKTYKANHNNVVPLALLDAVRHIFKDYKNIENYPTLSAFTNAYLKDMKANYGVDINYTIEDIDPFLDKILDNKEENNLVSYFKFIEKHKLWQNGVMKTPGGLDAVNTGNLYYYIDAYDRSAKNFAIALQELEKTVEPGVYFSNLYKGITAFQKLEDFQGLLQLLLKSKTYLNGTSSLSKKRVANYLLFINYEITKLSAIQKIAKKEGKKAKKFCLDNYQKNKWFTLKEIEKVSF